MSTKAKQIGNETITPTKAALYSAPVSVDAKQYLLNESQRTGLSQKELIDKAIESLKAGKPLPNALPIVLKK